MAIEVRPAHRDDADALAAAHTEGWRVGYRDLLPDDFLDAPEFAATRLARWRAWTWRDVAPGCEVFVAVVDGTVAGFGHCGPEREQPQCDQAGAADGATFIDARGEVYAFYLHPTWWGSGAAMPLMRRCEQFLCGAGFGAASLWVLRDNPRARTFYEKAGWSASGREQLFMGPQTASRLPEPLPEVEYLTSLANPSLANTDRKL